MITDKHILPIDTIFNSHKVAKLATFDFKLSLSIALRDGNIQYIPDFLLGQPPSFIDDFFEKEITELELTNTFRLLATTEAELRFDFAYRVRRKLKDPLSRYFRDLQGKYPRRIHIDKHIIESWQEAHPEHKRVFSEYRSALELRNWIAHGRAWTPKLGKKYDTFGTYSISSALIAILKYHRRADTRT